MIKQTKKAQKVTNMPRNYVEAARRELEAAAIALAGLRGDTKDPAYADEEWKLLRELETAAFHFASGLAVSTNGKPRGVRRLRGEEAIAFAERHGLPLSCWATSWGTAFRSDLSVTEAREAQELRRKEREKCRTMFGIAPGEDIGAALGLGPSTWEQIFIDVEAPRSLRQPAPARESVNARALRVVP